MVRFTSSKKFTPFNRIIFRAALFVLLLIGFSACVPVHETDFACDPTNPQCGDGFFCDFSDGAADHKDGAPLGVCRETSAVVICGVGGLKRGAGPCITQAGMVGVPGATIALECAGTPCECGSPGCACIAGPPHFIDRTERTTTEFEACLQSGACTMPSNSHAGLLSSGGGQIPALSNLADARALCTQRGARLCTEAEWEIAARGGPDFVWPATAWPWDSTAIPATCALVNIDFQTGTCTGTLRPISAGTDGLEHPLGLSDIIGNTAEWVDGCAGGPEGGCPLGCGVPVARGATAETLPNDASIAWRQSWPNVDQGCDDAPLGQLGCDQLVGTRCCLDF